MIRNSHHCWRYRRTIIRQEELAAADPAEGQVVARGQVLEDLRLEQVADDLVGVEGDVGEAAGLEPAGGLVGGRGGDGLGPPAAAGVGPGEEVFWHGWSRGAPALIAPSSGSSHSIRVARTTDTGEIPRHARPGPGVIIRGRPPGACHATLPVSSPRSPCPSACPAGAFAQGGGGGSSLAVAGAVASWRRQRAAASFRRRWRRLVLRRWRRQPLAAVAAAASAGAGRHGLGGGGSTLGGGGTPSAGAAMSQRGGGGAGGAGRSPAGPAGSRSARPTRSPRTFANPMYVGRPGSTSYSLGEAGVRLQGTGFGQPRSGPVTTARDDDRDRPRRAGRDGHDRRPAG